MTAGRRPPTAGLQRPTAAAAAGQTLTDADRAKLEAHARMLKEELARKAEADAKDAGSVKPKN